jgi:hypothetical protein
MRARQAALGESMAWFDDTATLSANIDIRGIAFQKNKGRILETFITFLPLMITQLLYAVLAVQIAKRRNKSVPLYFFVSIIPIVGAFFFVYVMWTTILYVLDSINELKSKA